MEIISVIESINGEVYSVTSFSDYKKAEEYFCKIVKEHDEKVTEDDLEIYLENGVYESYGYDLLIHSILQ